MPVARILRRTLVTFLVIGVAIYLILLQRQKPRSLGLHLVPSNSLALLILDELPSALPSLTQSRLYRWLEVVDPDRLEGLLNSESVGQGLAVFRANIEQAYLIVHGIESKSNGAYRPHLTALIIPRPFRGRLLRDWLVQTVSKRFKRPERELLDKSNTQMITGEEEGQLFYIHSAPPFLVVSNSKSGWREVERRLEGGHNSLLDSTRFVKLLQQVRPDPDLLLYVRRGQLPQALLPEFIYTVSFEPEGLSEEYFQSGN